MPDNVIQKCTCNVDLNGQFKYLTYPADQKPYCNIACPISAENNLVCGGHGRCALNHSDNTIRVCECEAGYEGLACDCTSDTCHSPRGQCRIEADANDKSHCIALGCGTKKQIVLRAKQIGTAKNATFFVEKPHAKTVHSAVKLMATAATAAQHQQRNRLHQYFKVLLYNLSNPTGLRKLLPHKNALQIRAWCGN